VSVDPLLRVGTAETISPTHLCLFGHHIHTLHLNVSNLVSGDSAESLALMRQLPPSLTYLNIDIDVTEYEDDDSNQKLLSDKNGCSTFVI
jgi:hypothetical protein